MDEDLEKLLTHPYDEPVLAKDTRLLEAESSTDFTSRTVKDYSAFRNSPDVTLRPHISGANLIESRFFSPTLPGTMKNALIQYAPRLKDCIDDLKKNYNIYVETATDDILEKEARRLDRRYFQQKANEDQIAFIRLKRFYEKIKTFHEIARDDWREINKLNDTLSVMPETQIFARQIEAEVLRGVSLLMRQTDSFLDALKQYMRIEQETLDAITGSYRTVMNYTISIIYTISAFFGEAPEIIDMPPETPAEDSFSSSDRDGPAGSIARNIIIESQERRLNRSAILSALLLGSRDWNRTPHYSMELPVRFYAESVENFKNAYHVNMDPKNILGPMNTAAALVRQGQGENFLERYKTMIRNLFSEIMQELITIDFPGLDRPNVFLYHGGPAVILNILLFRLRQSQLGEIFYLDKLNVTVREIPEELIKKELIEWWNRLFSDLQAEDVDSYLTYSRTMELVKKEFRALHEEGVKLRKKEQPASTYVGLEKWLKDNRIRVFGFRKIEVFKRFIPGTILDQN